MYTLTTTPVPELVTDPASEPVTLEEAKNHLNLSQSSSDHDDILSQYIAASRQQLETDINFALIQRTMRVKLPEIASVRFPMGPLVAVSSITYYDSDNAEQTLSTSLYSIDTATGSLRLIGDSFPTVYDRWDAVTINYTIGKATTAATVPPLCKSAILLLIGHYFENRDMLLGSSMAAMEAYERICRLLHRSSYP